MTLDEWADKWGIPDGAIYDMALIGEGAPETPEEARNEADVQQIVRLEAAEAGWHLWRNNRGAFQDKTGRWIRYGLANDSKKLGDVLKSHDLIGWGPRRIEVDDVGKIIAQFKSREIKPPGWAYTGTDREKAQLRWHNLVIASGGDSAIVNGKGSIRA